MRPARAESRYATGASWNLVANWYPARAVAASANRPYTPISTRPGPRLIRPPPLPGAPAGVPLATPHLVQAYHHDRVDQAGDAGDHRTPPGRLRPSQQEAHRHHDHIGDQVSEEGAVLVRPGATGQGDDRGTEVYQHQRLDHGQAGVLEPARRPV